MHAKALLGRALTPLLFPLALRRFYRTAAGADAAVEALRRVMATRDERLLAMARSEIYARPASPYVRLLRHAGCAYEDFEQLVRREGVDATLEHLAEQGVRLSDEEFRGRVDVVRGGLRFRVRFQDVLPARVLVGLVASSSGSGGSPLPCLYPMEWMRLEAAGVAAFLDAHGLRDHVHGTLDNRLTGGGGSKFLVYVARAGVPCGRWFVPSGRLAGAFVHAYHALVGWEMSIIGSRVGPGFPQPSEGEAAEVVAWIAAERRKGRRCCVRMVVSQAIGVTEVAMAAKVSLHDTAFIVSGEPLTAARRDVLARGGARIIPAYGFVPGGLFALGCGEPETDDDLHVMEHALATVGQAVPGETRRRLLVTSLSAQPAAVLLNVENGDLATMSRRACACSLGAAGLRLHVREVGSDRKLTLQGMNYALDDLADLVEHTLPATFGGSIGDYQLIEEDAPEGRTFLTLRVHPRVEIAAGADLLGFVREQLASGSRGKRMMANTWHDTGALRVVRQAPRTSARGKVAAVVTLPTAR